MMEQLKTAAAVFCTACICAELVGQLLGDTQGRRCIKGAAGLYILLALFHALPALQSDAAGFTPPQTAAESYGTAQQMILAQAQTDLAARLEEQIGRQTGLDVSLTVTLEADGGAVRAARVYAALAPGLDPGRQAAARRQVGGLLEEALALGGDGVVWAGAPGGG